jgi:hypothetical protein
VIIVFQRPNVRAQIGIGNVVSFGRAIQGSGGSTVIVIPPQSAPEIGGSGWISDSNSPHRRLAAKRKREKELAELERLARDLKRKVAETAKRAPQKTIDPLEVAATARQQAATMAMLANVLQKVETKKRAIIAAPVDDDDDEEAFALLLAS